MTNGETPADASKKTKGDLSYHYWHGRNTGEAPAATAKVRTNERRRRALRCTFFASCRNHFLETTTTTDERRTRARYTHTENHKRRSRSVDATDFVDANQRLELGGDLGRARAHGVGQGEVRSARRRTREVSSRRRPRGNDGDDRWGEEVRG